MSQYHDTARCNDSVSSAPSLASDRAGPDAHGMVDVLGLDGGRAAGVSDNAGNADLPDTAMIIPVAAAATHLLRLRWRIPVLLRLRV
jgi:hypothetical protein